MSSRPQIRKLIRLPQVQTGANTKLQIKGGKPILNLPKGLKITSIKTLKSAQVDNQASCTSKQKEDLGQIRVHVQEESSRKPRQCSYSGYTCDRPLAPGSAYCSKHVAANATKCTYVSSTGKRCLEVTTRNFCLEHGYATFMNRLRNTAAPSIRRDTDTMLLSLAHYVRPERVRTESCASAVSVVSDPEDSPTAPVPQIDPFKQINATSINSGISQSLLECNSDSDSDVDVTTVGDNPVGVEEDSSGGEETHYETRPLSTAGIYTSVEVVSEARMCLRLLQAAYMRRLRHLRSQLASARASYLRELKKERENHCSIHTQATITAMTLQERKQMKKLKAYINYRKRLGVDAVLARKLHHKRAKVSDPHKVVSARGTMYGRCVFTEGGVRCDDHSMPAAKHCLKHIMNDTSQVLFSQCGDMRAGIECRTPVAKAPWGAKCLYHTDLPPYTVYTIKKDGTDSEGTESESGGEEEEVGKGDLHLPSDQEAIDMDFVDSMAVHLPRTDSESQSDAHDMNSVPDDFPNPKSVASDFAEPNSIPGDFPEPESIDSHDPNSGRYDMNSDFADANSSAESLPADEPMSQNDEPQSQDDESQSQDDEPQSQDDEPQSQDDEPSSQEDESLSQKDESTSHYDEPMSRKVEPLSQNDGSVDEIFDMVQ